MEYADGGTLRNYLGNNFSTMSWNNKYQFAFQIATAVECLHNEGIVHRDLVIECTYVYLLIFYIYNDTINIIFLFLFPFLIDL